MREERAPGWQREAATQDGPGARSLLAHSARRQPSRRCGSRSAWCLCKVASRGSDGSLVLLVRCDSATSGPQVARNARGCGSQIDWPPTFLIANCDSRPWKARWALPTPPRFAHQTCTPGRGLGRQVAGVTRKVEQAGPDRYGLDQEGL